MKRIVFSTVGSLGDVHPYIAIGKELLARGHRPIIATTDRYRTIIEAERIEYGAARAADALLASISRS